jgi:hypothetical protein
VSGFSRTVDLLAQGLYDSLPMTSLRSLFEWVDAFPSAIALRESDYGYPYLLAGHVVGMLFFAGLIVMMDLRLAGLAHTDTRVSQVQKGLFPWQMISLALAVITGGLLLYSQPLRYWGKGFFWMKMAAMGLAGVNALVFHLTMYRSVARWDSDAVPPFRARVAGIVSIVLWALVVVFGRLTAYDWLTTPEF